MPIYDYKCNNCDYTFEKLVLNAKDEKDITCGKCGSKNVKRHISSFSPLRHLQADKNSGCSSGNGFS
ncbi:MAG: zinc ribbon domain-containing protein [Deltaproteobacteria bacterium]|nr:zinc ribbon domain-containing protein [Deltaproteobacteria bacterium]